MTSFLEVWSNVDPRDLRINKKFRNSPNLPPGVSRAQDHLILDIKMAIPDDFVPDDPAIVGMSFFIPSNRMDVDAPIKRTLDALEKAMKAKGFQWHDGKVRMIHAGKSLRKEPGIRINMYR